MKRWMPTRTVPLRPISSRGKLRKLNLAPCPLVRLLRSLPPGRGREALASNECEALGEEGGGGVHAVCLVPRGAEEGFSTELQQPAFEVLANQPVAFQLFSSSTRLGDHLGDVVYLNPDEVSALLPIRTVLRFGKQDSSRNIPVRLALRLTEIGILELWCQSQQTSHRWQLQFDVRTRQEGETQDGSALPAGKPWTPSWLKRLKPKSALPSPKRPRAPVLRRNAWSRSW